MRCETCGQQHTRCTGHTRTGQPCTQHAVRGADVCRMHGGGAPQVQAAAARRLERAEAERAVQAFGLPRDIDPAAALLEEVARAAGAVAWLDERVRTLDPEIIVWGPTKITDSAKDGRTLTEEARISVWVELWQKERKHLVDVCAAAVKAGVEERRVRLAEAQGQLLADVIRNVLDDPALGLDAERRAAADAVVHRHLTLVAGGAS